MFTGIIQAVGTISATEEIGGDIRMRVAAGDLRMDDVQIGDSIAVSGVCLTVVEIDDDGFATDVSRETLERTALADLEVGDSVNLEKAMQIGDYLGGHLVSGHVDGIGEVLEREGDARSVRFRMAAPKNLARYIAAKGSICIDGVSLTVNTVSSHTFEVNIVPHTLQETTMNEYVPGRHINLEVDIIARYVERMMHPDA